MTNTTDGANKGVKPQREAPVSEGEIVISGLDTPASPAATPTVVQALLHGLLDTSRAEAEPEDEDG